MFRRLRGFRSPSPPCFATSSQLDRGALYRNGGINQIPVARMVDEHVTGRSAGRMFCGLLSLGPWVDIVHEVDSVPVRSAVQP